MANNKSAEKRDRKAKIARRRNVANRKTLKVASKKFQAVLAAGDKGAIREAYNAFSSVADKSAKKGAISKNAASRYKSRASLKVATLVAAK